MVNPPPPPTRRADGSPAGRGFPGGTRAASAHLTRGNARGDGAPGGAARDARRRGKPRRGGSERIVRSRERARDALLAELGALAGGASDPAASGSGGSGFGSREALRPPSVRARELVASVRPENIRWFAELVVARLGGRRRRDGRGSRAPSRPRGSRGCTGA